MVSRDPDELKAELRDIDFTGDVELLRELRDEARVTVEGQQQMLSDVDTKASRILRINLVLLGIIVSAISIAAQNGGAGNAGQPALDPLLNVYVELGVLSLVLSTVFAGITYTASELDVGVSADNVQSLLDAPYSTETIEELLVKNYIVRINFNRSENIRNIPLIQLTILLVLAAMILFSLAVYQAVLRPVELWVSGPAVVLFLVAVVVSGLPKQIWRAIEDIREWR